jgi:hypothetical protein
MVTYELNKYNLDEMSTVLLHLSRFITTDLFAILTATSAYAVYTNVLFRFIWL